MAKYKVKVIGHLCKGNHVAKFGEIVDESQLTTPASGLINTGFIELVEDVKEVKSVKDIDVVDAKQVKPKR